MKVVALFSVLFHANQVRHFIVRFLKRLIALEESHPVLDKARSHRHQRGDRTPPKDETPSTSPYIMHSHRTIRQSRLWRWRRDPRCRRTGSHEDLCDRRGYCTVSSKTENVKFVLEETMY